MAGGGGSQEVKSEPWKGQKPYLTQLYQEASNLYGQGAPDYFPGQTYVDFSPQSLAGLQGMEQQAMGGSLPQQGYNQLMSGHWLDQGNPAFSGVADSIAAQVQPRVQSMYAGAGRSGESAGAQAAMTGEMTRALAPYAYGNYESERGRMQEGLGMAGMLGNYDAQQLMGVGGAYEGKSLQELQDQMQRFNYGQNAQQNYLSQFYAPLVGGYGSGYGTTTQPGADPLLQYGSTFGGLGLLGALAFG